MTAVHTGKPGRIDCCNGYNIIVGVNQVQCFSESEPEVDGFNSFFPSWEMISPEQKKQGGILIYILFNYLGL
jgi:hypothetical protein